MEGQEELSTNTMKVRRLLEESFVKIQVPSGDLQQSIRLVYNIDL